jgi:hypothetical protein
VSLPWSWGAPEDHDRHYPADDLVPTPAARMTRTVDVDAAPALVYRWLCQISQAPYSYDLLDNRGRRSPSQLTPGADRLRVGQRMVVYEVTGVEAGHSWTGRSLPSATRLFGPFATTYAAEPLGADRTRLVCRLVARRRRTGIAVWLLAWGDLVMMRKQLLTLRRYAERDAHAAT